MYFRKLRNLQYAAACLSINIVFEYIFDEFGEKNEWYVVTLIHLFVYSNITIIKFEKKFNFMRFFEKLQNMNSKI